MNNIFEWVFLYIFLTVSHCIFCGLQTNNGKIETFPITFHTGMIFASFISHWQSFKRKQERTYSLALFAKLRALQTVCRITVSAMRRALRSAALLLTLPSVHNRMQRLADVLSLSFRRSRSSFFAICCRCTCVVKLITCDMIARATITKANKNKNKGRRVDN